MKSTRQHSTYNPDACRPRPARLLAGLLLAALLIAGVGLSAAATSDAPAPPASGPTVSITLSPTLLTTLVEGAPAHAFGSADAGWATVGWSHREHLGRRRALVGFDLGDIPPAAQIVDARLTARISAAAGLSTMRASIAPLGSAWNPADAAWANQPLPAPLAASALLGVNGSVEWPAADLVRGWLAAPTSNHGLLLDSLAGYPEDNERTLSDFALQVTLAAAEIELHGEVRTDPVAAGDYVEYMLDLRNVAGAPALAPSVTAQLPPETRFASCSDGCVAGDGGVAWTLADLAAGDAYRVYLTARVAPETSAGSTLTFSALTRAFNSPDVAAVQIETGVIAGATATKTGTPTETTTVTATRPASPTATFTTATPTRTSTATRFPTRTPTIMPTAGACGERVVNGGFEQFTDGWTAGGETPPVLASAQRHSGVFSMLLGSSFLADAPGDSILSQSVRIPADATSADLSLWYLIDSTENDARYDWFAARVLDPAGQMLELVVLTGEDAGWTIATHDLLPYRGQTVRIEFLVHNDGTAGRTMAYLDDISLCVERPAGPEPAPVPYPGNCRLPDDLPDYAPAGLPDFSARQDGWTPAIPGRWSHDGPAAAADVLWWLDSRGEPGDAPPPNRDDGLALVSTFGDWDDHAPENVVPLIDALAAAAGMDETTPGVAPDDLAAGLRTYLVGRGLADAYSVQTIVAPAFDAVRDHLRREEGVVLLVGFYQWQGGEWSRFGGRYLAAAGAGCDGEFLAVSDPLRDAAEAGFAGDVWPIPDHAHAADPPDGLHNDAAFVSHDIYPLAQIDGSWGLAGYAAGADDIVASIGLNTPAGIENSDAPLNPTLPIAARVEYAIVVGAAPAAPSLDIYPGAVRQAGAEPLALDVVARTGITAINGGAFTLEYDPLALEVVDENGLPASAIEPGAAFDIVETNGVDAGAGQIRFAARRGAGGIAGETTLATIRMRPLVAGVTTGLSFVKNGEPAALWQGEANILAHLHGATIRVDAGATLELHLGLVGRPAPPDPRWELPALIALRRTGDDAPGGLFGVQTDDSGRATLPVILPAGQWAVTARAETTLGIVEPWADLAVGPNTVTLRTLPEGDANGDNRVAVEDISVLAGAYGAQAGEPAFDPRTDFDRDGTVGPADLELLTGNLGRIGDVAAQPAATWGFARWEPAGMAIGSVSLSLIPSVTKVMAGDVFPVAIGANSYAQAVDAAAMYIDFDPAVFQVVDAAGAPADQVTPSTAFGTVLANRVDNVAGRIDLAVAQLAGAPPAGAMEIGSFYLQALRGAVGVWVRFSTGGSRRSAVAYRGEEVTRTYNAMRVAVERRRTLLPLLLK